MQGWDCGTGLVPVPKGDPQAVGLPHACELALRWGPGAYSPTTNAEVPRSAMAETPDSGFRVCGIWASREQIGQPVAHLIGEVGRAFFEKRGDALRRIA